MSDDEGLPRYSYDLIKMLDESVAKPGFPNTANGFYELDEDELRRAAFTAGARSLVDQLMYALEEMERGEEEAESAGDGDISDESARVFPRLYETSREVREVTSSVRLAPTIPEAVLDD